MSEEQTANNLNINPLEKDQLIAFSSELREKLVDSYNDNKGFICSYKDNFETLSSQCAGSVALLLLIAASDGPASDKEKVIIGGLMQNVIKSIENDGYNIPVDPKIRDGRIVKNVEKFKPNENKDNYHYMDTVSWVLSFMCLLLHVSDNKKMSLKQVDIDTAFKTIKECLSIIINGVNENKGSMWGLFNKNCDVNWFATYSISEALNDFFLYIVGEDPQIRREPIKGALEFLGEEMIINLSRIRAANLKAMIKDLGEYLGDGYLFDDHGMPFRFDKDCFINSRNNNNDFLGLYNLLFIIDSLIVNKNAYDNELYRKYFGDFDVDSFNKIIEYANFDLRKFIDKASGAINRERWDDPSVSIYKFNIRDANKAFNSNEFNEPGIIPLFLRVNVVFSYYISQHQEKRVLDAMKMLLDNRNADTGLWDDQSHELFVTERAIEAFVDYWDYYKKYIEKEDEVDEKKPSDISIDQSIQNLIKRSLQEYMTEQNILPNDKNQDSKKKVTIYNDTFLEAFTQAFYDMKALQQKGKPYTNVTGARIEDAISAVSDYLVPTSDSIDPLLNMLMAKTKNKEEKDRIHQRWGNVQKRLADEIYQQLTDKENGVPDPFYADILAEMWNKRKR